MSAGNYSDQNSVRIGMDKIRKQTALYQGYVNEASVSVARAKNQAETLRKEMDALSVSDGMDEQEKCNVQAARNTLAARISDADRSIIEAEVRKSNCELFVKRYNAMRIWCEENKQNGIPKSIAKRLLIADELTVDEAVKEFTAAKAVEEAPAEEPVAEEAAPAEEAPVEEPVAEEVPAVEEEPATEETPVEETPVEEPVAEVEPEAVEETPAEEPVEEVAAVEAEPITEEAPVEEPVAEEAAPVEDAPVEEPVAEEAAAVEEEPATEEAPVEEAAADSVNEVSEASEEKRCNDEAPVVAKKKSQRQMSTKSAINTVLLTFAGMCFALYVFLIMG